MMKKNKLYTINRFNRGMFQPKENLFDGLTGSSYLGGQTGLLNPNISAQDFWGRLGVNTQLSTPSILGQATTQQLANFAPASNAVNNPFSIKEAFSSEGLSSGLKAAGPALISAGAGIVGGLANKAISGGLESKAGSAISNIGSTVGSAVGAVNPIAGAVVNVGSQLIGGLTNRAFGMKTNQEALNKANAGTSALSNFVSDAGSFDDIQELQALGNVGNVYKGGWFSGGKARRKNEELKQQRMRAHQFATRSIENNVDNLVDDQMNNALANYAAFGGPLENISGMDGAIGYGFMSDYLNGKRRQAEQKGQTNMFAGVPSDIFAFGGDMQAHGGDFPTGLTHINEGGMHEENPNDGVQMGVDNEGTPNLVEEGETVWNDYVFSNRIPCDETTKKLFHLPKKKDVTYAEVSKKLEREISERPNDPISRAGFNAQMQKLEEQQERQKQEMEAERAKAAFEALSPEEQQAVIQQVANGGPSQGDGIEGQTVPEEAMMAANSGENPTEVQGVVPTADAMGTVAPQEDMNQQMMAEGGKLFEDGGNKKKNVGTWKNDKENHWDVFTKPGLRRYIENLKQRLAMAPDDETKNAIRKEAMNELNSLQQSYFTHVLPDADKEKYDYSEDIKNHQLLFDKLYGNTGFYSTDENGNVRNLIADAINLPNGAATEDKPEHWADGYNGRRTSIRNFGSTEYGDDKYYKDLVDEFAQLGLTYAPNENWKYGDNRLYALSLPEAQTDKVTEPKVWDWNTGDWVDKTEPKADALGTVAAVKKGAIEEESEKQTPKLRPEWMRYAGLFGPAAGLGLMAAGVGKPDYSRLDAALESAGDAHLASYKPLGNYLTYRPMDIWFEQNRMDANARATDRAIMNSSSPSKMAGLLASGYNSQIVDGELYRKALEYNDAKRAQVAEFNRGTDQFNAQAYNQNQQFNADARNKARQYRAGLAMQAATERMNRDAGWYNSLYGNVAGLFRGLGDLGRENAQWNMISRAAADTTNLGDSNTADIYLKKKKKSQGGKVRRKRGLTY